MLSIAFLMESVRILLKSKIINDRGDEYPETVEGFAEIDTQDTMIKVYRSDGADTPDYFIPLSEIKIINVG